LAYRPNSTDALVIREILDREKGCAYSLESDLNMPDGFSLKGHSAILDIGAHIGVFSRYAIEEGCRHVIAYEPESNNFNLLSQNLNTTSVDLRIELHLKAVSKRSETRTLVRARAENDGVSIETILSNLSRPVTHQIVYHFTSGKENTWRHALSEYTQYIDKSTKLPSESQKPNLDRIEVQSVSFFNEAMVPGVSFVKLDCEGAEIEILLSLEASERSSWLDVTHLVVEWSFTKERRVEVFHQMISNLKRAGFDVSYEGMGSWWDIDANVMWPYPNDLLVFAKMRSEMD
jgi:FkbM family methyltransferase